MGSHGERTEFSGSQNIPPQADVNIVATPSAPLNPNRRVSGLRSAGIAALGLVTLGTGVNLGKPEPVSAFNNQMTTTAAGSKIDCDPTTLIAQAQQEPTGNARISDSVTSSVVNPYCPPTGNETGNDIEIEGDEVDQRLNAWLDGTFRPDLKIEEFFTRRGRYAPLNIVYPEYVEGPEYESIIMTFQGVYLTKDIVPAEDGDRLILYFGLEAGGRERYFVGLNAGKVESLKTPLYGLAYQETPNRTGDNVISTKQLIASLEGKEGNVMIFKPSSSKYERTVDPDYKDSIDESLPQQLIADDFIRLSADIVNNDLRLEDIPADSPVMQYVINHRITEFDPTKVIFSFGIAEMRPPEE